jgi:hypothetical protein
MKGSPERQALEEALKDESVGSAKMQALGDYAMLKDIAQFIRICRWLRLIYKDQLAPLENAPFFPLWARKRYRVA